jgi:hypothetical protein
VTPTQYKEIAFGVSAALMMQGIKTAGPAAGSLLESYPYVDVCGGCLLGYWASHPYEVCQKPPTICQKLSENSHHPYEVCQKTLAICQKLSERSHHRYEVCHKTLTICQKLSKHSHNPYEVAENSHKPLHTPFDDNNHT